MRSGHPRFSLHGLDFWVKSLDWLDKRVQHCSLPNGEHLLLSLAEVCTTFGGYPKPSMSSDNLLLKSKILGIPILRNSPFVHQCPHIPNRGRPFLKKGCVMGNVHPWKRMWLKIMLYPLVMTDNLLWTMTIF